MIISKSTNEFIHFILDTQHRHGISFLNESQYKQQKEIKIKISLFIER